MKNDARPRPIKVVVFTENLVFGGINRYCLDLVEGLKSYPDIKIYLLAPRNSIDQWLSDQAKNIGIEIITLSGNRLTVFSKLKKLLAEIRPNILHTQGYYSNVIGRLAVRANCLPIKLLNTVHGVYHFHSAVFQSKIWYALDYATMGFSDKIITVSKTTSQQLTWMGLQKRISIIANGTRINPLPSKENILILRKHLGLPQQGKIVCFVGRLSPQKGINSLIKIIHRIIGCDDNVSFIIVGDGEQMPTLQLIAYEYPGKVFLFGKQADVSDFYDAADIFLLTSITEGLPMTIIEAFAHGLPAVATRVGGVPEIVLDGVNGLLCAPSDVEKLSQDTLDILHNDKLHARFSKQARKIAEETYSLEQMIKNTHEIYVHLV
jgi:glycosyltransferase involved in cell wall biosynthesis